MRRKCEKCKQSISADDFICPHCGTIVGDPVSYAAIVNAKVVNGGKKRSRFIVPSVIMLALILLVGAGILFVKSFFDANIDSTTGQISTSTTTTPTITESTLPLVTYSVHISASDKTDLTGTIAHVYNDGHLVYSGQLQKNGKVQFVLPKSNGYYIQLTGLPVQYTVHYENERFFFINFSETLQIVLEPKPVPYTLKVVDSKGDPISGVGIRFNSSGHPSQDAVTDENGCCVFTATYGVGIHSCNFTFVPNGYVLPETYFYLRPEKLDFTFDLQTYAEAGIHKDKVYTVRVVDENGEPITGVSLLVYDVDDGTSIYRGTTNMEGCFSFVGKFDAVHNVSIQKNADYYGVNFTFEKDTQELIIQLDHKAPGTKYTYTVKFTAFVDTHMVPVAGVQIGYWHPDSGELEHYTSDENGIVTFETITADPAAVQFKITYFPDGYCVDGPADWDYGFDAYRRSTSIMLDYDGKANYTFFLQDDAGAPVVDSGLMLLDDGHPLNLLVTDKEGMGTFRYFPNWEPQIELSYLNAEYQNYVIEHIEFGEGHQIYITIAPMNAEYTYTVSFVNQDTGEPVSGVQIGVDQFNGSYEYYTSDENGVITFLSAEPNPFDVYFHVSDCPDNLTTVYENYYSYHFQSYDRSCTVYLKNDGKLSYHIYLKDHEGSSVAYALLVIYQDDVGQFVEINGEGLGTIRLSGELNLKKSDIILAEMPEGYKHYIVDKIEYGEDRCIYITICPDNRQASEE